MILHIIPDSGFTDFVIDKFYTLDFGEHKFLILSDNNELYYTKKHDVTIISNKKLLTNEFIKNLNNFDHVVVHSMFSRNLKKMILKANKDISFVWIGWGGDYYETIPELKNNLYDEETAKLVKLSKREQIKKILKKLIPNYNIDISLIYERVTYFAPVIYNEYDLLENIFKPFHTEYLPFSYGQLENDLIKGIENLEVSENNILLGNSASYTNNHLDIFYKLSTLELENRKVITPLSYGNKYYRKTIIKYGNELLNQNFYPQTDFLKKETYHNLISSCSITIMNHKRQQSMGNIITMLYIGSKLFLNKENIVYQFLKEKGFIIFSIDEINNNSLSSGLCKIDVETNQRLLEQLWSKKAVDKKYLDFIKILKEKTKSKKISYSIFNN